MAVLSQRYSPSGAISSVQPQQYSLNNNMESTGRHIRCGESQTSYRFRKFITNVSDVYSRKQQVHCYSTQKSAESRYFVCSTPSRCGGLKRVYFHNVTISVVFDCLLRLNSRIPFPTGSALFVSSWILVVDISLLTIQSTMHPSNHTTTCSHTDLPLHPSIRRCTSQPDQIVH